MDQEGGGNGCVQTLPEAVKNGTVNASAVAQAFRRLFRARIRLGMLDPPVSVEYNRIDKSVAASEDHLDVALRAAQESICLYKNGRPAGGSGEKALPLAPPPSKRWRLLLAGAQGNSSAALIGNCEMAHYLLGLRDRVLLT